MHLFRFSLRLFVIGCIRISLQFTLQTDKNSDCTFAPQSIVQYVQMDIHDSMQSGSRTTQVHMFYAPEAKIHVSDVPSRSGF